MRKITLSALALGLVLAAGSASAGTLNDDFTVTLQVDAMCAITQPASDLFMLHDPTGGNTSGSASGALGVVCNKDLPYTLEVDSFPGGAIVLTDGATSKTVQANLKLTNQAAFNPVVWGHAGNGEAFADIGTGLTAQYQISVAYENGEQPAVGVYNNNNMITLTF